MLSISDRIVYLFASVGSRSGRSVLVIFCRVPWFFCTILILNMLINFGSDVKVLYYKVKFYDQEFVESSLNLSQVFLFFRKLLQTFCSEDLTNPEWCCQSQSSSGFLQRVVWKFFDQSSPARNIFRSFAPVWSISAFWKKIKNCF